MAISYPLTMPSEAGGIANIAMRGTSITSQSVSPFTMQEQIQVFPGQQWSATITLPQMKRIRAEQWSSFLLSLNGRQGTFLMGDPAASTPQGVATGTPLVNGANQAGNQLIIDGCTNSIVGWLKAGDYFNLVSGSKYRLHKLLQDATTDSSGNTTLTFWPNLRESPSDDAPLTVVNAVGQFRLAQSYVEFSIDAASTYTQSYPVVEAM